MVLGKGCLEAAITNNWKLNCGSKLVACILPRWPSKMLSEYVLVCSRELYFSGFSKNSMFVLGLRVSRTSILPQGSGHSGSGTREVLTAITLCWCQEGVGYVKPLDPALGLGEHSLKSLALEGPWACR